MNSFIQRQLEIKFDYETIRSSANLEELCSGRFGANLVADMNSVVRTTTQFRSPNQLFSPLHTQLITQICNLFPEHDLKFNNILFEEYDDRYRTMSYHSDQALDLVEPSFIAIFSCYRGTAYSNPSRSLFLKKKQNCKMPSSDPIEPMKIPLFHNSVVLFSTSINACHLHKIILSQIRGDSCIFMTFRLSKGVRPSTLATDQQRHDFYHLRKQENVEINFKWPEGIYYTMSPGDLMEITTDKTTLATTVQ